LVGSQHFAIGMAACALGEAFTQPAGRFDADGNVATDPVAAYVVGEVTSAAGQQVVKRARSWVEWLASKHEHSRLVEAVVCRMVSDGWLISDGRHLWPKDSLIAGSAVAALMAAAGLRHPASDPIRVLAGVSLGCGLAPQIGDNDAGIAQPLRRLTIQLPRPLLELVTAVEDAVHAVATRLR
jgi:hypothetical protein